MFGTIGSIRCRRSGKFNIAHTITYNPGGIIGFHTHINTGLYEII